MSLLSCFLQSVGAPPITGGDRWTFPLYWLYQTDICRDVYYNTTDHMTLCSGRSDCKDFVPSASGSSIMNCCYATRSFILLFIKQTMRINLHWFDYQSLSNNFHDLHLSVWNFLWRTSSTNSRMSRSTVSISHNFLLFHSYLYTFYILWIYVIIYIYFRQVQRLLHKSRYEEVFEVFEVSEMFSAVLQVQIGKVFMDE